MSYKVGDLKNSVETLERKLRLLGFNKIDIAEVCTLSSSKSVSVTSTMIILKKLMFETSHVLSTFLLQRSLSSQSKDLKIVLAIFDILRESMAFRPMITAEQFLSRGFSEHKIIILATVAEYVSRFYKRPSESGKTENIARRHSTGNILESEYQKLAIGESYRDHAHIESHHDPILLERNPKNPLKVIIGNGESIDYYDPSISYSDQTGVNNEDKVLKTTKNSLEANKIDSSEDIEKVDEDVDDNDILSWQASQFLSPSNPPEYETLSEMSSPLSVSRNVNDSIPIIHETISQPEEAICEETSKSIIPTKNSRHSSISEIHHSKNDHFSFNSQDCDSFSKKSSSINKNPTADALRRHSSVNLYADHGEVRNQLVNLFQDNHYSSLSGFWSRLHDQNQKFDSSSNNSQNCIIDDEKDNVSFGNRFEYSENSSINDSNINLNESSDHNTLSSTIYPSFSGNSTLPVMSALYRENERSPNHLNSGNAFINPSTESTPLSSPQRASDVLLARMEERAVERVLSTIQDQMKLLMKDMVTHINQVQERSLQDLWREMDARMTLFGNRITFLEQWVQRQSSSNIGNSFPISSSSSNFSGVPMYFSPYNFPNMSERPSTRNSISYIPSRHVTPLSTNPQEQT